MNRADQEQIIQVNGVSLFREKKPILQNISWNVNKSQHWVVFGRNGSGKTMLLKVVTGYVWPTTGSVSVLGKRFGEVNLRELRTLIGWVSSDLQQIMQQQFSAEEVVLSGHFASIGLYDKPAPEVVKKARSLMEELEIDSLKNRQFPLLSYGEQKRVLIARALMHDPRLLILDEPATGLDIKAREQFLDFVERFCKRKGDSASTRRNESTRDGPTVILVTHHLEEIIPSITHVLALKNGKIVTQGEKETVLTTQTIKDVLDVEMDIEKIGNRYVSRLSSRT